MPSKSKSQAKLMAGVSHSPKFAKKVGIKGAGILKKNKPAPMLGDNRAGRLKSVMTDRGEFRMKSNKKDED